MRKKLSLAIFALLFLTILPTDAFAATTAKAGLEHKPVKAVAKTTVAKKVSVPAKKVVAKKKARVCAECKSRAEGVDNSKAAKGTSWTGTVIGINEGEMSLVITEAKQLNHIKAFAQRSVRVTDNTKILTKEGEEKDFANMDIGYRIQVKGVYDPKKRIVRATAIEIVDVPDEPITKTK